MIQFKQVRLHGFKSFVDKTEFDISMGLTGVVGPNGCGKSNLVEALRWSMGESSSKRMRGGSGSMEDVIFNGTASRPARALAEVTVLLDNTRRTAPVPWNEADEIEVTRRIEREHGSTYKINGKTVRARDVQLLYADILSGANSPFLISQGKVTALIQAKPVDRRQVLEEAAGISGLYARRHEAELRLRATDANLARLEDLVRSMEERLGGLKKQARQANKYRNLAAQIRQLEVMIAGMEWCAGHERLHEIERKFAAAESAVAERLTVVSQLGRTQSVQAQDIPGLRQQEAEMSAALQALRMALQRLEDEEQRIAAQTAESKAQAAQARTDRDHEQQTLSENTAVLQRLDEEEKEIAGRQAEEDSDLQKREETRDALKDLVAGLDSAFTGLMEKAAADRATRQSLQNRLEQDRQRAESVRRRIDDVRVQLENRKGADDGGERIAALRSEIETLENRTAALRAEIERQEAALEGIRAAHDEKRAALQDAQNRKSKSDGEIGSLESVIRMYEGEEFRPVFDDVRADEGFELALSRALGDTLMASTDGNAPAVWESRGGAVADLPALPPGVAALEPHVRAPAELKAALSQIGFVDGDSEGSEKSAFLKPGQSLVSRGGAYWRWDGLHIKATAADSRAVQLRQKNRLAELQNLLPEIEREVETRTAAFEEAGETLRQAQQTLSATQADLQSADREAREKRISLSEAVEAHAERLAELAKLGESLSQAETDLRALEEAAAAGETALAGYGDARMEDQQREIDEAREKLLKTREDLQNAIRDYEIGRQEQSRRLARLQAIGDERVNLQNRCIRAGERIRELTEREESLGKKIDELKKRPSEIRKECEDLLSRIGERETEKSVISDRLAACEAELADTTKALKEAEALLNEAREQRAHALASREERASYLEHTRVQIQEQFGMTPEDLSAEAALDPDNMPDMEQLRQTREKAVRDRDSIGPVNLRADQEAEELEKELSGILAERGDLMAAVEELRQGIQKLNREARERLNEAFEKVNAHFQDMFTRLFNGGKAHLSLIESDDPLQAGLEIFAQPPGKALQSLSLLSGGEQTLTAVALIFAMFLTNPAPICVMDEVDAPLDDANVDRFCDLLDEFAQRGETRFILITHHRLTMARMDRLYGVTMAERGISQLVSVDMNQQLDFLEAAE